MEHLTTPLWHQYFRMFELDEIMRQQDNQLFACLLNRLREGHHTVDDIECLKTRLVHGQVDATDYSITHLYTQRSEVNAHNQQAFSKCGAEKDSIVVVDTVSGNFPAHLQKKVLEKVASLQSTQTKGLHSIVHVGVDLPAELSVNVDVLDGLANGTPCIIKKLDYRMPNSSRCSIVWVQFEDHEVGIKWRNAYRHLKKPGIQTHWTPVLEKSVKFSMSYYKFFTITRRQFPLCLAAAKTVHKAQGSTMAEAVVHLGQRKIDHMHYVALSRVRNLRSIQIKELNVGKISLSQAVVHEMKRLRENALVDLCIPKLNDENRHLPVVFLNCRSLSKHVEDLKHDFNLMSSSVVGLVETRLKSETASAYVHLQNFKIYRNDCHRICKPMELPSFIKTHSVQVSLHLSFLPMKFQHLLCNSQTHLLSNCVLYIVLQKQLPCQM